MRGRDPRDILAIIFVLAGVLPIAWWVGSWVFRSMKAAHLVQGMLVVVALALAWWFRKRLEGR
jgi:hypothetical protein